MATGQKLMRAIRVFEFGGPEVLKLQSDVVVPVPQSHQVLIKMSVGDKDKGVDVIIEMLANENLSNDLKCLITKKPTILIKPALPYTPGSDVAGIIESVGDKVSAFKKGDRVFCYSTVSGGYAEFALAADDTIYPLPETLNFRQGAALGIPYFTACRALFHSARARAGESVLVHGASGGVGLATCQIARAHGLKVLGTAGSEEGKKLVLQNGAHEVFNLSHGGRVVVVGCRGPIEINPRDTMAKETSIIGVSLSSSTKEEFQQFAGLLQAGIEKGWVKPVIGSEYPLEKAAQAHEDIIHGSGKTGKMILLL